VDTPISYSRRGGAQVGGLRGSWPFGKIDIANGAVTVSVMGRSRTLTVAEVLRAEPLGFFKSGGGAGVRIFFRGQHWEEYVDFHSMSAWREVLAELKYHGFTVREPPAT
jgi:hypothetical protein